MSVTLSRGITRLAARISADARRYHPNPIDFSPIASLEPFASMSSTVSSKESNVTFLPLGANIQEFKIKGRNIVLNFPTEELYVKYNAPYFGETIGRVANRISGAKINNLNGQSYQLVQNNGPNSLHGGENGFGKQKFEGPTPVNRNGKEAVLFKYLSPDGDQGYPGDLELRVWYSASMEAEKTVLEIEYEAELVGDDNAKETVVGITNHRWDGALALLWKHSDEATATSISPTRRPLQGLSSSWPPTCIRRSIQPASQRDQSSLFLEWKRTSSMSLAKRSLRLMIASS